MDYIDNTQDDVGLECGEGSNTLAQGDGFTADENKA